jgi:8-oxo-dGTP pyrophosphatase MutT (NUDIX family)
LPYRKSGPAPDAPFEVMLVTSRGTGRWVLPKGNVSRNLSDHAAAEREALEEAGVLGAICPVPIGNYRYRKLSSGASLQTDVAVFPSPSPMRWKTGRKPGSARASGST